MNGYIVSARKYRPATFESVVGQKHITSTLKNAVERSQIAHGYIFCGPRGVGKTTCARIFAKSINCLNSQGGEPCNECESCLAFSDGRSFNIHELDAASNNGVEDIRNLIDQVRIPPQIGRYSVYIIDEVHMLSQAAFNAFLKTLEEPPGHAIFILATTEKHKLLPTILSRCQIFDFNRIRVEDGVDYLKYIASQEGVTYDDESLFLISHKADGGMRDALSMFDKAVSFCGTNLTHSEVSATLNLLDYDTYFALIEKINGQDYQSVLLDFDAVLSRGFSPQIFMAGLCEHLRSLLMCKNPQTIKLLDASGSLADKFMNQSTQCAIPFLFDSIALMTSLDYSIRSSSNQRLAVELALMKMCGLGEKKNPDGNVAATPTLPNSIVDKSEPQPQKLNNQNIAQVSEEKNNQNVAKSEETEQKTPRIEPQKSDIESISKRTEPQKRVSISGSSIDSLLKKEDKEDVEIVEVEVIDADSEQKLNLIKDRLISTLKQDRPRIGFAFEEMIVSGNTIKLEVGNIALKSDIEKCQNEILGMIIEMAEIKGIVRLEMEVSKQKESILPLKAEDKYKFLYNKNSLLQSFIEKMELESM